MDCMVNTTLTRRERGLPSLCWPWACGSWLERGQAVPSSHDCARSISQPPLWVWTPQVQRRSRLKQRQAPVLWEGHLICETDPDCRHGSGASLVACGQVFVRVLRHRRRLPVVSSARPARPGTLPPCRARRFAGLGSSQCPKRCEEDPYPVGRGSGRAVRVTTVDVGVSGNGVRSVSLTVRQGFGRAEEWQVQNLGRRRTLAHATYDWPGRIFWLEPKPTRRRSAS